jgi:hypothetical protein
MNDLIDVLKFKPNQAEKWCMFMDARKYKKDLSTFWSRVTSFAEPPLDKTLMMKYRLLVVDNFDSIPPSSQQILKRIMEAYTGTLKYLFICPDPKACMTAYVLSKSTNFRTRSIQERDALQVVLAICNQHRIGFEREGIKTVFSLNPNRSLSNMLDLIEEVFLKLYFVSRENVLKLTSGKSTDVSDLPVIPQYRAVEPFERCKACTLVPPCQHITLEDLVKQGVARRKELPRYKTGSMSCPSFMRYGYCTMFNEHGHCSLDHPKNLHVIKKFAVRCPQCSIVWPCNHCNFTKNRRSMQDVITELHARIGRIRAINVPEPPVSLTRHLVRTRPTVHCSCVRGLFANTSVGFCFCNVQEHIVAWREQLRHIGRKYMTAEYAALIAAATEWLETGYCTKREEYRRREKTLREAFGEMYTTHILDDPAAAQGRAPSAHGHGQGLSKLAAAAAGGSIGSKTVSHAPRPTSPGEPIMRASSKSPSTSPITSPQGSRKVML